MNFNPDHFCSMALSKVNKVVLKVEKRFKRKNLKQVLGEGNQMNLNDMIAFTFKSHLSSLKDFHKTS